MDAKERSLADLDSLVMLTSKAGEMSSQWNGFASSRNCWYLFDRDLKTLCVEYQS
jgi:hypothetical protein